MPPTHRISDNDFVIEEGDHVFFELTTQSGDDRQKDPHAYIKKKVAFHNKIISNQAYMLPINGAKHVLVFCFNGADHRKVGEAFGAICEEHGICRGTTVYLPSDTVDQWDLELTLAENDRELGERDREIVRLKRQLESLRSQPRRKKRKGNH
jgi:hypothetical protein